MAPGRVALLLPPVARRGAGALPRGEPVRAVLVGDALRRHRHRRQGLRHLLRRAADRPRHAAGGARPGDVHRARPSAPRRASRRGAGGRVPGQPRGDGGTHPDPGRRGPRRPPRRRAVRLGRPGEHRAHLADARDPPGLPLRPAPQAGGVDRPGRRQRRSHRWRHRRRPELPRSGRDGAGVQRPVARQGGAARGRRGAGLRPDHADAALRGLEGPHQPPHGVPRGPDAARRRRQRHHPQLDDRRCPGAQPVPRAVRPAARRAVTRAQDGPRDPALADAAGLHAPRGDPRHGPGRPVHPPGRQGRDVVRRRQPRRAPLRGPGRVRHRPSQCPSPPRLRHRDPPLHGQPPGRAPAADPVGGAARPLRRHRGARRARAHPVELRARVQLDAGPPHPARGPAARAGALPSAVAGSAVRLPGRGRGTGPRGR